MAILHCYTYIKTAHKGGIKKLICNFLLVIVVTLDVSPTVFEILMNKATK